MELRRIAPITPPGQRWRRLRGRPSPTSRRREWQKRARRHCCPLLAESLQDLVLRSVRKSPQNSFRSRAPSVVSRSTCSSATTFKASRKGISPFAAWSANTEAKLFARILNLYVVRRKPPSRITGGGDPAATNPAVSASVREQLHDPLVRRRSA